LALPLLMLERGLDANGRVNHWRWVPAHHPIYAAIASGEPQLVSEVISAGGDVRGDVVVPACAGRGDGAVCRPPLDLAKALGCPEIIALISRALC
jgi:hypothetical protein